MQPLSTEADVGNGRPITSLPSDRLAAPGGSPLEGKLDGSLPRAVFIDPDVARMACRGGSVYEPATTDLPAGIPSAGCGRAGSCFPNPRNIAVLTAINAKTAKYPTLRI